MIIQIVVFDGVDELDVVGPYEVFQIARDLGADIETTIVSMEGIRPVRAAHDLRFAATGTLGDPRPGIVIVPGGGWLNRSAAGVWTQVQSGAIAHVLENLYRDNVTLAAVCTGAFLLGAAGLLKGVRATTHRGALEDLRSTGAQLVEGRVVDENQILTSGGVTAGLDLALHIVGRQAGDGFADKIANQLEYQRRGPVV